MSKLSITLLFDDDTSVRLEGDSQRVTALIRKVPNEIHGFIKHDYYMQDHTDPVTQWDISALTKLLNEESKNE